jgi:hypothetical protein
VLAEGDALFLVMPEERRRELEQRYSRVGEAFARVREAVEAEERAEERERGPIESRGASSTSGVESARRRPPKAGRAEREEKEHMRT